MHGINTFIKMKALISFLARSFLLDVTAVFSRYINTKIRIKFVVRKRMRRTFKSYCTKKLKMVKMKDEK